MYLKMTIPIGNKSLHTHLCVHVDGRQENTLDTRNQKRRYICER